MATTTKEVQILITIANQAKEGLTALLRDLAAVQSSLNQITQGFGTVGENTDGLNNVADKSTDTLKKIGEITAAVAKQGVEAGKTDRTLDRLGATLTDVGRGTIGIDDAALAIQNAGAGIDSITDVINTQAEALERDAANVDALADALANVGQGADSLEEIGKTMQDVGQGIEQASQGNDAPAPTPPAPPPPPSGGPTLPAVPVPPPTPPGGPTPPLNAQTAAVERLTQAYGGLLRMVNFVAGGFLALQGVGLIKGLLDAAARTETLAIVMNVVGRNAGYTAAELAKADAAVQKLGITAESSRESLTQLMQSGISLELAKPLARASQDLAVVSGMNSSDTFKRLITNIDQMDTMGLRFMGIMIDKEAVMARAAESAGKAITGTAQKQVFANAVLAEAEKLSGVYEASLNSVGKMLGSMPRYVEEFRVALGALGQGAYTELVKGATEILKSLTNLARAFTTASVNADTFGAGAEAAGEGTSELGAAIKGVSEAIVSFNDFLAKNAETIKTVTTVVYRLAVAFGVAWATAKFMAFYATLMGFLPIIISTLGVLGNTLIAVAARFGIMWLAALGPVGAAVAGIALLGGAVAALAGALGVFGDKSKKAWKDSTKEVDQYLASLARMDSLAREKSDLAEKRETASNRSLLGTAEERATAKKEAEEYTKRIEEIKKKLAEEEKVQTQLQKAIDQNGKLDPNNANRLQAGLERAAAFRKELVDLQNFKKDLSEALNEVGSDMLAFNSGVSFALTKQMGAIDTQLSALQMKGVDTAEALSDMMGSVVSIGGKVGNNAELEKFDELLSRIKIRATQVVPPQEAAAIASQLANLRQQVAQTVAENNAAEAAGGEKALNALRGRAKQAVQERLELLQGEIDQRKNMLDMDLASERARYDLGLTALRDYYDRRRQMLDQSVQDEADLAQARIRVLEVERTQTNDEDKKRVIDFQIAQERDRVNKAELKAQKDKQALVIEEFNTRIRGEQSIAQLREDLNRRFGNDEAAIRSENARLLQQELEQLGGIATAQDRELITLRAQLDLQGQLVELTMRRQQSELAVQRAMADLTDAQNASANSDGNLSTLDLQEATNETINRRLNLLVTERDSVIAARDEYFRLGEVGKANELNLRAIQMTAQMYDLRDAVQSVGETLEDTFVDSFASNFQALLSGTKSFKDAFLGIFKDLNSQILKILTRDFAEDMVKAMKGDGKGGGLFGKLGELVTGKPQAEKPEVKEADLWATEMAATKEAITSQMVTDRSVLVDQLAKLAEIATNTANLPSYVKGAVDPTAPTLPAMKANEGGLVPFDIKTVNALLGKKGTLADPANLANSPIFDQAAKTAGLEKFGLNGDFLRYMAAKESAMDPTAVSPVGAEGLMQIMPANFKALGLTPETATDPLKNVMAGAKLLAENLARYNGDLDKALAAYNAGPKVAQARSVGDFSKQSPANKEQTDDYVAKLGMGSKIFSATNPLPVQVISDAQSIAEPRVGQQVPPLGTLGTLLSIKGKKPRRGQENLLSKSDEEDAEAAASDALIDETATLTETIVENTRITTEFKDTNERGITTTGDNTSALFEATNSITKLLDGTYQLDATNKELLNAVNNLAKKMGQGGGGVGGGSPEGGDSGGFDFGSLFGWGDSSGGSESSAPAGDMTASTVTVVPEQTFTDSVVTMSAAMSESRAQEKTPAEPAEKGITTEGDLILLSGVTSITSQDGTTLEKSVPAPSEPRQPSATAASTVAVPPQSKKDSKDKKDKDKDEDKDEDKNKIDISALLALIKVFKSTEGKTGTAPTGAYSYATGGYNDTPIDWDKVAIVKQMRPVDTGEVGPSKNGFYGVNVGAPDENIVPFMNEGSVKVEPTQFAKTVSGPLAGALGMALQGALPGPLGVAAGRIVSGFSTNLIKSGITKIETALKEGFTKIGDEGTKTIGDMSTDLATSMSHFFGDMSQSLDQFFSTANFSSNTSSGGGLDFLAGLFGGDSYSPVSGNAVEGAIQNVMFAEGGYVSGPGTGTSDSIAARLSNGEYVMTANMTAKYRPLLDAMRAGALDTRLSSMFSGLAIDIPDTPEYATGGYVSETHVRNQLHSSSGPRIAMTVITQDANSFRKSQDHITAKMAQAVNRSSKRNL